MKFLKIKLTSILLSGYLLLSNNIDIYGKSFNDIDDEHWAYSSIKNVSSLGLLVGDLSGYFNPNSYISKFETIKILAKINGFNHNTTNEKNINYYRFLYEKYKEILKPYELKYSKWDSNTNYEISYLLENKILNQDDLNKFIVLDKSGNENLRALSKEEIAVFLVRIMGKEEEVSNKIYEPVFKDNNNISENSLNSVYYLKDLGILTGNIDGNFYPKNAITRAEFAVILSSFLNYNDIKIKTENFKSLSQSSNLYTQFGVIEKLNQTDKTIQIKTSSERRVYKLSEDIKIEIDGKDASTLNISEGFYAELIINNNFVTKIIIKTNVEINSTPNISESHQSISGFIKSINADSFALSYNSIGTNGFLEKEKIEIIPFSEDYKVIKSGVSLNKSNLNIDSLVTVNITNNVLKEIYIEEENSTFIGNLIDKSKDSTFIVISTNENKILKLKITEETKISKNNKSYDNINSLSIGDKVTINAKKNKITELNAKGKTLKKTGIVTSINISNDKAYVTLQDINNYDKTESFSVNTNTANIYSVKILDKVLVNLDSKEIYGIKILETNNDMTINGEILEIDKDYITVSNKINNRIKVYIDKLTTFFYTDSLQTGDTHNLKIGDEIYAVLKNNNSEYASIISISSK